MAIWFMRNPLTGRGAVGGEKLKDELMTWTLCIGTKSTNIITSNPSRTAAVLGLELVDG